MYQYLSFKHLSAEERIAAMHANEIINVKAWYKILYNINLETEVMYEYKIIKLGQILKEANHNEFLLFLAVENGSGANDKDIHVVINLQVKLQASRWIQY